MGTWLYINLIVLGLAAYFGALEIEEYYREAKTLPNIDSRQTSN